MDDLVHPARDQLRAVGRREDQRPDRRVVAVAGEDQVRLGEEVTRDDLCLGPRSQEARRQPKPDQTSRDDSHERPQTGGTIGLDPSILRSFQGRRDPRVPGISAKGGENLATD